jgi:hypothetical protein
MYWNLCQRQGRWPRTGSKAALQKLHAYQAHSPKKKSSAERGTVLTYLAIWRQRSDSTGLSAWSRNIC